jgi:steroid delta-isomerase-like uncharacterized protein
MRRSSQDLLAGAAALTTLPLTLATVSGRSTGPLDRLSRKAFVGAGAAVAAGLLGAPSAFGQKREPRDARRLARLRARRERIVVEHAHTENIHRFDETLDTFKHARYEIIPLGEVHDGRRSVDRYYADTRTAFPDQRNADMVLRHADAAVIAEFHLLGTMKGTLRGIPPTNKSFKVRVTAIFLFEPGGTKIVCERVYFDLYSLLQQIGLLELAVGAGLRFPAEGGIPIDRREPGVKPVKT